jgi:adenylylsulfate kinase-like enzyme
VIILFCGIPGSGKSTVSTLLAERLKALGTVQLVNSDRLRGPIYRNLLKLAAPEQRAADFLILDATFYKREWREQIKAIAQPEKTIVVFLESPLNVALERNRIRDPKISVRAVHIMYHRMERPEDADLVIDTTMINPEAAAERIFEIISKTAQS